MPARSVQISIDAELLEAIDRQPEAIEKGRSALIRRALRLYLELERRREVDAAYERAYGGHSEQALEEVRDLLDIQSWPEK